MTLTFGLLFLNGLLLGGYAGTNPRLPSSARTLGFVAGAAQVGLVLVNAAGWQS